LGLGEHVPAFLLQPLRVSRVQDDESETLAEAS
jgi:hypothetical protein